MARPSHVRDAVRLRIAGDPRHGWSVDELKARLDVAYDGWLHQLGVRFVAVSDSSVDFSAVQEKALIERGLPYLHLAFRSRHWSVYAVSDPSPLVQGPATLRAIGPNSLAIDASCSSLPRT